MLFVRNVRKMKYIYNAPLLRRSFSTTQPLRDYNYKFQKFKLKQARMQSDDGRPVYLKGGTFDKILFKIVVAMVLYSTIVSIGIVKEFLRKS